MQKLLTRKQHGLAEATYIPTAFAAPRLADFGADAVPAQLARAVSAAALGSALLARAEWGAVKVVPFRMHLALDVGVGLLTFAAPWIFGFARDARARNAFLAMGAVAVLAGMLTEAEEMPG